MQIYIYYITSYFACLISFIYFVYLMDDCIEQKPLIAIYKFFYLVSYNVLCTT